MSNKQVNFLSENDAEKLAFNSWRRKRELKESLLSLGLLGLYGASKFRDYRRKKADLQSAYRDTFDDYAAKNPSNPIPSGKAYDALLAQSRNEGEARFRERKYGSRDEFLGKVMDMFRPPPGTLKSFKTGGKKPLDKVQFSDIEGLHPHELGPTKKRGTFRQGVKDYLEGKVSLTGKKIPPQQRSIPLDLKHPNLSRFIRSVGPIASNILYKLAAEAKTSMAGTRPRYYSAGKIFAGGNYSGRRKDPYRYSPGIDSNSSFADKMADREARRSKMGLKPLKYPEE